MTAPRTAPASAAPAQRREARSLLIERGAIDEATRTVHLAFASETPVERVWGVEVLDCSAQSIRAGRLSSGANLLCDHDIRDVVGVIESFELGADRVVRAAVRFGRSARADEVWQDVRDGIRRNVSVGYFIHGEPKLERRNGLEAYRVTDWEPYEVSLVSVPADTAVGIGRAADVNAQPGTAQAAAQPPDAPDAPAAPAAEPVAPIESPAAVDAAIGKPRAAATPIKDLSTMTTIAIVEPAVQPQANRDHAAEISKIAASVPGGAELAMRSIQAGHTVEQFQAEALRVLATKPVPTADIGMSANEVRSYSMLRAINALSNPADVAAQRAAAFEREASDAVTKVMGKSARGFYVPMDVQRAQRDLTAGTNNAGGFSVSTDMQAGSFIDALRNAMVIMSMGTRMLTGLQGNVAIPKLSSGATHYWVAENAAPTESQQTLAQVTLTPKTVGAFTDISRRLLLQSSIDVENMVRTDLATVLGLAVQGAAINGSGASNQPSGLLTLVTPAVIGGTNGLAPTWAHMVALETAVAVANADVGTLGYLTNAKVRGKLKSVEKAAGTTGNFVWGDNNTPINGYRTAVTNAVPSNLTKGTASGICSAILFGNFADLMIGMWGSLDLMVDPYTGSTAGTVRVVALQDVDIAVRNVESFATMVDALTT